VRDATRHNRAKACIDQKLLSGHIDTHRTDCCATFVFQYLNVTSEHEIISSSVSIFSQLFILKVAQAKDRLDTPLALLELR